MWCTVHDHLVRSSNVAPAGCLLGDFILENSLFVQAPVVQKLDSAIQRINLYPLNSAIGFPNTYPLDSDLSDGKRYPTF